MIWGTWLAIMSIVSLSLTHTSVMCLARLRSWHRWILTGTLLANVLLAASLIWKTIYAEPFDLWVQIIGVLAIVVTCGTIMVPVLARVARLTDLHEIQSAALDINLTCPRSAKSFTAHAGRSKCPHCRLGLNITIEEERCSRCGNVLFGIESAVCPECGQPIAYEPTAETRASITRLS